MLMFFKNGHAASCGVPNKACNCESRLYVITGLLGITAGAIQGVLGYFGSLALLSDALHALSDGVADFFAAIIAIGILRAPHREDALREIGRKVIALALAGSAVWIVAEALERAFTGTHVVVPLVLAAGGAGGAVIDALRLSLLRKAQDTAPNSLRAGLIAHAQSDLYRSVIAAGVGTALVVGEATFATPGFKDAVAYLDLGASAALSVYMLFLAKGIWRGEHTHTPGKAHHHEHGCSGGHHRHH